MTKESISNERKAQIAKDLHTFVQNIAKGSANQASKLIGISNAYVSKMINGNWDSIADDSWRKVEKKVNNPAKRGWNLVRTDVMEFCHQIFEDTREHAMCYGMVGNAGCGKDVALSQFSEAHDNFWYINCAKYWNLSVFLREVTKAMGMGNDALSAYEMMSMIKEKALKSDRPVIVLNEADKLSDTVLLSFVTFYNELEDECGLIMIATEHLERKILRGYQTNKMGYRELYSRIGSKFIRIPHPTIKDIEMICRANGVDDTYKINSIYNEEKLKTDLRRVKRLIHKEHKKGGVA